MKKSPRPTKKIEVPTQEPKLSLTLDSSEIQQFIELGDGRVIIVATDSTCVADINSKAQELRVINELLSKYPEAPRTMRGGSFGMQGANTPVANSSSPRLGDPRGAMAQAMGAPVPPQSINSQPARANATDVANLVKNIHHAKAQLTESRLTLISTDPRDPSLNQIAENVGANYDHLANLIEQLNVLTP